MAEIAPPTATTAVLSGGGRVAADATDAFGAAGVNLTTQGGGGAGRSGLGHCLRLRGSAFAEDVSISARAALAQNLDKG